MNKLIVTPIALFLLAITLVGCGDEDDSIFGSEGSNKLTITSFASSYDNQANASAIARIDQTFSTGEYRIIATNIINNYSNQSLNSLNRTVLADNFEGRLENADIEVNGRTVKRPIYEKNSNNQLNFETTYRTLDLSGVSARDYSEGNNFGSRRGILTDLNNYPKIPTNISFPTGSVCYIPVTNSERSFLAFNDKNRTGYQSLDKWVDAAEQRFSDNRSSSTSRFNVGSGNTQKAAQVTFFEVGDQPAYLYNGVEYEDSIYEADYVVKGATNPNTDSRDSVVDCTLVNEVAGDFLAEQIDFYY